MKKIYVFTLVLFLYIPGLVLEVNCAVTPTIPPSLYFARQNGSSIGYFELDGHSIQISDIDVEDRPELLAHFPGSKKLYVVHGVSGVFSKITVLNAVSREVEKVISLSINPNLIKTSFSPEGKFLYVLYSDSLVIVHTESDSLVSEMDIEFGAKDIVVSEESGNLFISNFTEKKIYIYGYPNPLPDPAPVLTPSLLESLEGGNGPFGEVWVSEINFNTPTPTETPTPTNTFTPTITSTPTVTPTGPLPGYLAGRVFDATGDPIQGVYVYIDHLLDKTKKNGFYELPGALKTISLLHAERFDLFDFTQEIIVSASTEFNLQMEFILDRYTPTPFPTFSYPADLNRDGKIDYVDLIIFENSWHEITPTFTPTKKPTQTPTVTETPTPSFTPTP